MSNLYPNKALAEEILEEAEHCNPGPWGNHSRVVAMCAEKIATACDDMDGEKAYILGLLHDIGRKFGGRHLGHVYDGYTYMLDLNYPEAAKICLTHSFNIKRIEDYIGNFDVTLKERKIVEDALANTEYDDYDRLIQMCDAIGTADGPVPMEERMGDVKRRYGNYPQEKWDKNMELRSYFEKKMGRDLYEVIGKG